MDVSGRDDDRRPRAGGAGAGMAVGRRAPRETASPEPAVECGLAVSLRQALSQPRNVGLPFRDQGGDFMPDPFYAELLRGFPVIVVQDVVWGEMDAYQH